MAPPKDKEDVWAFNPIGSPFPEDPVRAHNQNNMYVALWYKHGKPTCGRAWNDGGKLNCSFPYNKVELTGAKDLGGQIQVLQYKGGYEENGFTYKWITWKEHRSSNPWKIVRCGDVCPVLLKHSSGHMLMGQMQMSVEKASIAWEGKEEVYSGPVVDDMLCIARDPNPPPPPPPEPQPKPLSADWPNTWCDVREGDLQRAHGCQALGRPLKTENGDENHFAALWYKHGEPVMGRCFIGANGKYGAAFGWHGVAFTNDVGSFQVLLYKGVFDEGFHYDWKPFKDAFYKVDGWKPVSVGDRAPCVIKTPQGYERLGQAHMVKEIASVAWGGKEEVYTGPVVQSFLVLCRKP